MSLRGFEEKFMEKSTKEVDEDVDDGARAEVVRWDRFLPRMVLRVLLVEADDSTRRIISALLRKCSYRVTAVSDGLKAWETIRERPQSIDIIITEVDLPSISGYALLTLVMEHDACKNIPVIMMSSQDSVSTVFKYMLRGAGDFLIKPIRSNELRNLWQHVWRKHTLRAEQTPSKTVASFENNAMSNYSSGCASPSQKHKGCSDKEGDTQSSCTMPCVEGESAYTSNMHDYTNLKSQSSSILSNMGEADQKPLVVLEKEMSKLHGENVHGVVSEFPSCYEAYFDTPFRQKEESHSIQGIQKNELAGSDMHIEKEFFSCVTNSCDDECNELPSRAIDLIATIDIKPKLVKRVFSYEKMESAPKLELSLKRVHPSSYTQWTDDIKLLNHSNASAFSLYTSSKTLQPRCNILSTDAPKPDGRPLKFNAPSLNKISGDECTFQRHDTSHKGNGEHPVVDDVGAGYNHVVPTMCFAQYGLPTGWNTRQTCEERQPEFPTAIINQPDPETTDNAMEESEVEKTTPKRDSPTAPHSTSSTLCDEISDYNWQEAVEKTTPFESSRSQYCMSRREAALTKFRLKRKDRCYGKKVRYQSRKRLAEQRPRIKGQFVRQVKADHPPINH